MMLRTIGLAAILGAGVGCGSSGPPALIGDFTVADAVFNTQSAAGFGFYGDSLIVAVANVAGVCDSEAQGHAVPSSKRFTIALASVDAAGAAVPAPSTGRYTISPSSGRGMSGLFAQVFYVHQDPTCYWDVDLEATAGDVTLTRLDAAAVEGDLNLTAFDNIVTSNQHPTPLPTGDHVTAHFAAASCNALDVNAQGTCPQP